MAGVPLVPVPAPPEPGRARFRRAPWDRIRDRCLLCRRPRPGRRSRCPVHRHVRCLRLRPIRPGRPCRLLRETSPGLRFRRCRADQPSTRAGWRPPRPRCCHRHCCWEALRPGRRPEDRPALRRDFLCPGRSASLRQKPRGRRNHGCRAPAHSTGHGTLRRSRAQLDSWRHDRSAAQAADVTALSRSPPAPAAEQPASAIRRARSRAPWSPPPESWWAAARLLLAPAW